MEKKTLDRPTLNDILGATMVVMDVPIANILSSSQNRDVADCRIIVTMVANRFGYKNKQIADLLDRSQATISDKLHSTIKNEVADKAKEVMDMVYQKDARYWAIKFASNPEDAYIKNKLIEQLTNED